MGSERVKIKWPIEQGPDGKLKPFTVDDIIRLNTVDGKLKASRVTIHAKINHLLDCNVLVKEDEIPTKGRPRKVFRFTLNGFNNDNL